MRVRRSLLRLAAAALALALPACSATDGVGEELLAETRTSVRDGSSSLPCEWPAVAALDLDCSATLVHPELVVYAAHCGEGIGSVSFGENADRPERVVETRRCQAHPRAALGNGFDLAFCLLAEPIEDIAAIPIAAGCELEALHAGVGATLVGFGLEREGGAFGVKRSAPVVLGAIETDLVVASAMPGTCAGDSGGPLLVDVPSSPGGRTEARLVGVVSAAEAEACEPTTDHYSYAPDSIAWLESASGRDLTPCFASDGSWWPTPHCVRAGTQPGGGDWSTGCGSSPGPPEPLATCGPAFSAELLLEMTPPNLEVLEPARPVTELAATGDAAEISVEATVSDAESGVADVRFELRDVQGRVRAEERDETTPYRLERLRLPPGNWMLNVIARDHASNERGASRSLVVTEASNARGGACAFRAPVRQPAEAVWVAALALVTCAWGARGSPRAKSA